MKKVLSFVLGLSFVTISAQNVGVNTTSPEFNLDVRSLNVTTPGQLNLSNLDKSKYLRFFSGSEMFPDPSITWQPSESLLFASFDDATLTFTEYMRISSAGDVGIGTPDPEARLDVKGGDWNLEAGNPGDLRVGNSAHNLRIGVATGGGGAGISRIYSSNNLRLGVANTAVMTLDIEGETGFGTTNPSQKVHVNGKLKIGDDAKAPSEGTIRFNSSSKTFEGYDGNKWIKLGGSGPFGNTGSFNLPDNSFLLDINGEEVTNIENAGDLLVVRSRTSVPSGIPNINTYRIYVDLFQQGLDGDWSTVLLRLSSIGEASDRNFAKGLVLENGFLLVGDPLNKKVSKYAMGSIFWSVTHTYNSPNTSVTDLFGWSVAYDQGLTMIGAPQINIHTFPSPFIYGSGRAYIYDAANILEATLSGSGPVNGDGFGFSVDINMDRALVGAPLKDFGSVVEAGAATVYNFFNNSWSPNTTFRNDTPETDEHYGRSVSVENNDYLYIKGEIEGIDLRLVEDGFWTLKETISTNGDDPAVDGYKTLGFDKILYENDPGLNKTPYLVLKERDNSNLFQEVSLLINGTAPIATYDITDNNIYTITADGMLFQFIK